MAFIILFITVSTILLVPADALAWGLGVHLQLGSQVLGQLHLLPETLRQLLAAHPFDFLYGCISADITLGKRFTHYLQHCHSWRIGCRILDAAKDDAQRACAYGYIAHLAADTIAHAYLVPYKLVRTFNTVMHKHTYWEMRFESQVDPGCWALARSLAQKDLSANDALLRSILAPTLFSFGTNKRLFNSLLLLSRLQQWQKMLRSMTDHSKWTLQEHDQGDYLDLAYDAVLSVLQNMQDSPYWKADPAGERALNAAKAIRKNLHLLWLEGKLPDSQAEQLLGEIKQRLRDGIVHPEKLLELLSGY
ncbi:zinc dependent phospholipase C family protein [Syntrophotalea carbinolica]|nr:zinc dependent phospholipase C family protein [Syntrophotalea carbinolica]